MKHLARFNFFLTMAIATLTAIGCGGVRLNSPGLRIRDADRQFDAAEAFRIKADKDKEREKWREQVQQKKALYDKTLNAYRAIIKSELGSKYAQRSLWQISEIYRRHYEWDKVTESYEAILAIAPLSYYADRAKSGIADIRKYRGLIDEKRRRYPNPNYGALYEQDNAKEHYDTAAQALYDVAASYEQLGDYPEAIANFQLMVDEFPEHEKAPAALTKIGEIHFYKLYDYVGGWPAYNKVIEMYPDSYDATQAVRLLKETHRNLTEIAQYTAEIKRYHCTIPIDDEEMPDNRFPTEKHSYHLVDTVIQRLQFTARCWEDLRNYPSAIVAYRTLADQLPYKNFAVRM